MTTLTADSFTGSNGSVLDVAKWSTIVATTGASASIQGNRARLNPGTLNNYNGNVTVKRVGSNLADVEVTALFSYFTANDGHLEVWARTTDGGVNPGNGYYLSLNRYGTFSLWKAVSFTYTQLASMSFTANTGTDYKFRFSVVGSVIKARCWGAYDPEPTTWDMSVTDTAITAAGVTMVQGLGGGDPGMLIDLDDIVITDGASDLTQVTKSAAISWDVQELVTKSAGITWDVNALVTKSADISWNVMSATLTQVTKSAAISWDVQQLITKSAPISWNILSTDDLTKRLWRRYEDGWRSISFSEI